MGMPALYAYMIRYDHVSMSCRSCRFGLSKVNLIYRRKWILKIQGDIYVQFLFGGENEIMSPLKKKSMKRKKIAYHRYKGIDLYKIRKLHKVDFKWAGLA